MEEAAPDGALMTTLGSILIGPFSSPPRKQNSAPGGVGVFDPLPQVPLSVFLGSP